MRPRFAAFMGASLLFASHASCVCSGYRVRDPAVPDGAAAPADAASSDAGLRDAGRDAGVDASFDAAVVPRDATLEGGADCPGADERAIRAGFAPCVGGRIGQSQGTAGVTCSAVCCVFGFAGCDHRAAQSGWGACEPADPARTGTCDDVFEEGWSSQCICSDERG